MMMIGGVVFMLLACFAAGSPTNSQSESPTASSCEVFVSNLGPRNLTLLPLGVIDPTNGTKCMYGTLIFDETIESNDVITIYGEYEVIADTPYPEISMIDGISYNSSLFNQVLVDVIMNGPSEASVGTVLQGLTVYFGYQTNPFSQPACFSFPQTQCYWSKNFNSTSSPTFAPTSCHVGCDSPGPSCVRGRYVCNLPVLSPGSYLAEFQIGAYDSVSYSQPFFAGLYAYGVDVFSQPTMSPQRIAVEVFCPLKVLNPQCPFSLSESASQSASLSPLSNSQSPTPSISPSDSAFQCVPVIQNMSPNDIIINSQAGKGPVCDHTTSFDFNGAYYANINSANPLVFTGTLQDNGGGRKRQGSAPITIYDDDTIVNIEVSNTFVQMYVAVISSATVPSDTVPPVVQSSITYPAGDSSPPFFDCPLNAPGNVFNWTLCDLVDPSVLVPPLPGIAADPTCGVLWYDGPPQVNVYSCVIYLAPITPEDYLLSFQVSSVNTSIIYFDTFTIVYALDVVLNETVIIPLLTMASGCAGVDVPGCGYSLSESPSPSLSQSTSHESKSPSHYSQSQSFVLDPTCPASIYNLGQKNVTITSQFDGPVCTFTANTVFEANETAPIMFTGILSITSNTNGYSGYIFQPSNAFVNTTNPTFTVAFAADGNPDFTTGDYVLYTITPLNETTQCPSPLIQCPLIDSGPFPINSTDCGIDGSTAVQAAYTCDYSFLEVGMYNITFLINRVLPIESVHGVLVGIYYFTSIFDHLPAYMLQGNKCGQIELPPGPCIGECGALVSNVGLQPITLISPGYEEPCGIGFDSVYEANATDPIIFTGVASIGHVNSPTNATISFWGPNTQIINAAFPILSIVYVFIDGFPGDGQDSLSFRVDEYSPEVPTGDDCPGSFTQCFYGGNQSMVDYDKYSDDPMRCGLNKTSGYLVVYGCYLFLPVVEDTMYNITFKLDRIVPIGFVHNVNIFVQFEDHVGNEVQASPLPSTTCLPEVLPAGNCSGSFPICDSFITNLGLQDVVLTSPIAFPDCGFNLNAVYEEDQIDPIMVSGTINITSIVDGIFNGYFLNPLNTFINLTGPNMVVGALVDGLNGESFSFDSTYVLYNVHPYNPSPVCPSQFIPCALNSEFPVSPNGTMCGVNTTTTLEMSYICDMSNDITSAGVYTVTVLVNRFFPLGIQHSVFMGIGYIYNDGMSYQQLDFIDGHNCDNVDLPAGDCAGECGLYMTNLGLYALNATSGLLLQPCPTPFVVEFEANATEPIILTGVLNLTSIVGSTYTFDVFGSFNQLTGPLPFSFEATILVDGRPLNITNVFSIEIEPYSNTIPIGEECPHDFDMCTLTGLVNLDYTYSDEIPILCGINTTTGYIQGYECDIPTLNVGAYNVTFKIDRVLPVGVAHNVMIQLEFLNGADGHIIVGVLPSPFCINQIMAPGECTGEVVFSGSESESFTQSPSPSQSFLQCPANIINMGLNDVLVGSLEAFDCPYSFGTLYEENQTNPIMISGIINITNSVNGTIDGYVFAPYNSFSGLATINMAVNMLADGVRGIIDDTTYLFYNVSPYNPSPTCPSLFTSCDLGNIDYVYSDYEDGFFCGVNASTATNLLYGCELLADITSVGVYTVTFLVNRFIPLGIKHSVTMEFAYYDTYVFYGVDLLPYDDCANVDLPAGDCAGDCGLHLTNIGPHPILATSGSNTGDCLTTITFEYDENATTPIILTGVLNITDITMDVYSFYLLGYDNLLTGTLPFDIISITFIDGLLYNETHPIYVEVDTYSDTIPSGDSCPNDFVQCNFTFIHPLSFYADTPTYCGLNVSTGYEQAYDCTLPMLSVGAYNITIKIDRILPIGIQHAVGMQLLFLYSGNQYVSIGALPSPSCLSQVMPAGECSGEVAATPSYSQSYSIHNTNSQSPSPSQSPTLSSSSSPAPICAHCGNGDDPQGYFAGPLIIDTANNTLDFAFYEYDYGQPVGRRKGHHKRKKSHKRRAVEIDEAVPTDNTTSAFLDVLWDSSFTQYILPYTASHNETISPGYDVYTYGLTLSEQHNCGVHIHVLPCSSNVQVWIRPNLVANRSISNRGGTFAFSCYVLADRSDSPVSRLTDNVFVVNEETFPNRWQLGSIIKFKSHSFEDYSDYGEYNLTQAYGLEITRSANSPDAGIYIRCDMGSANTDTYPPLFEGRNYCQSNGPNITVDTTWDTSSVQSAGAELGPPQNNNAKRRNWHFFLSPLCEDAPQLCPSEGWFFNTDYLYAADYVGPAYVIPPVPLEETANEITPFGIEFAYALNNTRFIPVATAILDSGNYLGMELVYYLQMQLFTTVTDPFMFYPTLQYTQNVSGQCIEFSCGNFYNQSIGGPPVTPNYYHFRASVLQGLEQGLDYYMQNLIDAENKTYMPNTHIKIGFDISQCIVEGSAYISDALGMPMSTIDVLSQLQLLFNFNIVQSAPNMFVPPNEAGFDYSEEERRRQRPANVYYYYQNYNADANIDGTVLRRVFINGITIALTPLSSVDPLTTNGTLTEITYSPSTCTPNVILQSPQCVACNVTMTMDALYRGTAMTIYQHPGCRAEMGVLPATFYRIQTLSNHFEPIVGMQIDLSLLFNSTARGNMYSVSFQVLTNQTNTLIGTIGFINACDQLIRMSDITCTPSPVSDVCVTTNDDIFNPINNPLLTYLTCESDTFSPTNLNLARPPGQGQRDAQYGQALAIIFYNVIPTDLILVYKVEIDVYDLDFNPVPGSPLVIIPTPCTILTGGCLCLGCIAPETIHSLPQSGATTNTDGVPYITGPVIIDNANDTLYASTPPSPFRTYPLVGRRGTKDKRSGPSMTYDVDQPITLDALYPDTQTMSPYNGEINGSFTVNDIGATLIDEYGCGVYFHEKNCSSSVQVWFKLNETLIEHLMMTARRIPSTHVVTQCALLTDYVNSAYPTDDANSFQLLPLTPNVKMVPTRFPVAIDYAQTYFTYYFPTETAPQPKGTQVLFIVELMTYPHGNVISSAINDMDPPFNQPNLFGFEISRTGFSPQSGAYLKCGLVYGKSEDNFATDQPLIYIDSPSGNLIFNNDSPVCMSVSSSPPAMTPNDIFTHATTVPSATPELEGEYGTSNMHFFFAANSCNQFSMCPENGWMINDPYSYTGDYVGPAYSFNVGSPTPERTPISATLYYSTDSQEFTDLINSALVVNHLGVVMRLYIAAGVQAVSPTNLRNAENLMDNFVAQISTRYSDSGCNNTLCATATRGNITWQQVAVDGTGAYATNQFAMFRDHYTIDMQIDECLIDPALSLSVLLFEIKLSYQNTTFSVYPYVSDTFNQIRLNGVEFYTTRASHEGPLYNDYDSVVRQFSRINSLVYTPDATCERQAFTPYPQCDGPCSFSALDYFDPSTDLFLGELSVHPNSTVLDDIDITEPINLGFGYSDPVDALIYALENEGIAWAFAGSNIVCYVTFNSTVLVDLLNENGDSIYLALPSSMYVDYQDEISGKLSLFGSAAAWCQDGGQDGTMSQSESPTSSDYNYKPVSPIHINPGPYYAFFDGYYLGCEPDLAFEQPGAISCNQNISTTMYAGALFSQHYPNTSVILIPRNTFGKKRRSDGVVYTPSDIPQHVGSISTTSNPIIFVNVSSTRAIPEEYGLYSTTPVVFYLGTNADNGGVLGAPVTDVSGIGRYNARVYEVQMNCLPGYLVNVYGSPDYIFSQFDPAYIQRDDLPHGCSIYGESGLSRWRFISSNCSDFAPPPTLSQSESESISQYSQSSSGSQNSNSLSVSHDSNSLSTSHNSDSYSGSHDSKSHSDSHQSDSESESHHSDSHSGSHDSDSHSKSHHSDSKSHHSHSHSDSHHSDSTSHNSHSHSDSDSYSQSNYSNSDSASHQSDSHSGSHDSKSHSDSHQSDSESESHHSDSHSGSHNSDSYSQSNYSQSDSTSHNSDSYSGSHDSKSHSDSHQSDSESESHNSDSHSGSHNSDSYSQSNYSQSDSISHNSDSHSTSHDSRSHSTSHDSRSHSDSHNSQTESESPNTQSNSPSHYSQSQSQSTSPIPEEACCNRSLVIAQMRNEGFVCDSMYTPSASQSPTQTTIDKKKKRRQEWGDVEVEDQFDRDFSSLEELVAELSAGNDNVLSCNPLDAPLDILPGGIYQVGDHLIPNVGPSTPFNDGLMRLGVRIGYVWLTFSDIFTSFDEALVKLIYKPGMDYVSLSGTAFGRIHDSKCYIQDIPDSLWPQEYTFELIITDGLFPIYGAGADLAMFIVSGSTATGSFYPTYCTASPCPVINFTLTNLSPVFVPPDIMPTVNTLDSIMPVQLFIGDDFPYTFPGIFTGIGGVETNCTGALPLTQLTVNSSAQEYLTAYACAPFFTETDCQGEGLLMFNIESLCNQCNPATPTPGLCPVHNISHTNSESESYSPGGSKKRAHALAKKPARETEPDVTPLAELVSTADTNVDTIVDSEVDTKVDTEVDTKVEQTPRNVSGMMIAMGALGVILFGVLAVAFIQVTKQSEQSKTKRQGGRTILLNNVSGGDEYLGTSGSVSLGGKIVRGNYKVNAHESDGEFLGAMSDGDMTEDDKDDLTPASLHVAKLIEDQEK